MVAAVALAVTGCGSDEGGRARAALRPELDPAARSAQLRRALELVSVKPSALGYRVRLEPRRNPGLRAQVDTKTRTITLFLARGDAPHRTAHDLAHELGHAWDNEHMTNAGRRAYLVRRHARTRRWFPTANRASDYQVGAGDFAEVYALCHAASPEYRSRVAPRPANACAVLPKGAR